MPTDIPVFYANSETISPYDKKQKLYAFAGIGYPKKFFGALDNVVGKKSFPDHYQYTDDDLKKLVAAAARRSAKNAPLRAADYYSKIAAQDYKRAG